MGGETEQHVSGWTVDTLAVYLQRQIDDSRALLDERAVGQRVAMDAALAAADRATTKAELAAERRFDSVNEFRGQLADQATTFLTRREFEALFTGLSDRITLLENRLNTMSGQNLGAAQAETVRRAGTQQSLQILGAVVAIVAVAVALILGLNN